jgi:ABC-type nitrate/sulfonate/bicarbonate transport system permease component
MKATDSLPRARLDAPPGANEDGGSRQRPHGARSAGAAVRAWRVVGAVWPPLVLLTALVALWHVAAVGAIHDPQVLPTPGAVARALVSQWPLLLYHARVTLGETLLGFACALVTGLALAAVIDLSPWLRRATYPLLVASQTVPIITLAPLLVFWFGFGLTANAIVVTLVCFFPIVVAAADGMRATDPELIRLYRTFGAGPLRIFFSVRVPGALPTVFSGIRIAVTYSVIGAIFGEYVGASAGLGFYIEQQQHAFGTNRVIAGILVTALLSLALFALTSLAERLALPWYFAQGRAEEWPS